MDGIWAGLYSRSRMPLAPGTRLDAYELVSRLGSGGMGEVWLARPHKLNRKVALKLLPQDLTQDPSRVARLQQEARAASALNHPNVCTIYALGETPDGQQFIAMEFVEGETLRQRLAGRPVTLREALDLAVQIASALSAAHAAGVVHRDVKPENVMVRRDGLVKVLDFGLAKLAPLGREGADGHTTHAVVRTDAGSVVGTVDYMSPEQARGQPVDARTDVWSLVVLLYELVAGRRPFAGQSSSEVLAGILEHEPAPLARFDPDTPSELQRIVGKALRKDREQRYQVMKDLLLDLQALRDEVAGQARSGHVEQRSAGPLATPPPPQAPASTGATPRSQSSAEYVVTGIARHKVFAALGAGILAVIIGGAWWAIRNRPTGSEGHPSTAPVHRTLTRRTFGPGLQTDVTWSPDGRFIAYASDKAGNFDIWVQPVAGGEAVQLTRSPAQDTQPDWSPDGRTIAFRSERDAGGLFIVPALGGPERQLTSFGVYPQWSKDGSEILFRTGMEGGWTSVHAVSPDGGDPPSEILQDFLRGGYWQWVASHPDGRISALGLDSRARFGFFTVSRGGRRVSTSTFAPGLPLQLREQGTRVSRFQWNATGTALYVEAITHEVRNLWKIGVEPQTLEWQSAARLTTGMGQDVAAALSTDGSRLGFTTQQESGRLWVFPFDAAAGKVIGEGRPVTPEEGAVGQSDLSPDGHAVAYELRRPGSSRVDLWTADIDSGASELLAQNARGAIWSHDGKSLAYTLFRLDRPPPGEWVLAVRRLAGTERLLSRWGLRDAFLPSGWTADDRAILGSYLTPAYTGPGALALWSSSTPASAPERVLIAADPRSQLWQGRFSPDGRWLSFVATSREGPQSIKLVVAPAAGAPAADWTRIALEHEWADKPRWAPDGRTLYFLSRHQTSFYNLWGIRFDPDRGKPVGEPFMVTRFDSPGLVISPLIGDSEIGISARRAMLTMTTVSGNIWMLDNVDR
jgi:serine/threonine protein kinase/Tol biopolymer transport system component